MSLAALPTFAIDAIVKRTLEEDLASGDPTTEACVDVGATAKARVVAREDIVVCGWPVILRVFAAIDSAVAVEADAPEGARVPAATTLWTLRGSARSILMGERVLLNLVQRMSGTATLTRAFVDALPSGSPARITDTRKTTPGLRVLERYAVRIGGGKSHRDNLASAILIKDNHIAACGGVARAIERARAYAPHTSKIECEVDSLHQLDLALEAGAEVVLLDNMDIQSVREAVRRARGKALLEASGGVTLNRVAELARAGVDVISVGALTHSAPAVDIGLDFE
jgi:nicotinate-nucleotide pyrophosphorylase (carboxylating)